FMRSFFEWRKVFLQNPSSNLLGDCPSILASKGELPPLGYQRCPWRPPNKLAQISRRDGCVRRFGESGFADHRRSWSIWERGTLLPPLLASPSCNEIPSTTLKRMTGASPR